MDNDQPSAPGPIDVRKHTSDNPVGREGEVDPRAAFLESERAVQQQLSTVTADPTAAILLTELQEIRARVDTFAVASLTAIWAMGMLIGYAGYVYFKNNPIPTEGDNG